MTEDEEWQAIQSHQTQAKLIAARKKATEAAHRLAYEHKDAMAHFTILQAFTLGYLEALKDE